MNCRRFQHRLYEFLDGTLSRRAQTAAEKHLSQCAACRQLLSQQRELAQSLSNEFRTASSPLQLPPQVRRRILAALDDERLGAPAEQSEAFLWPRWAWPLAAAASLALLAGAFFLLRAPGSGGTRPESHLPGGQVSIQLSYVAPSYTFQHEGGFVIDALTYHTNVVNERFRVELARLE